MPIPTATPATSRATVAASLARVEEGMTAEEARRIVGPPDEVRTKEDPGGITTSRTREIWAYGASEHLDFPTSGQIFIDESGHVQHIFGGRGAPPPASLFGDEELRSLLRLLARVPSYNGTSSRTGKPFFDPRALIRAVNALQPLGKERALAAIEELLRVSSWQDEGREGTFLVLRVLFELPSKGEAMPLMMVGGPSPPEPADPRMKARFPIAMAGDIPFLIVRGYMLAGHPQHPEDHLASFRARGELRRAPLHPAADPLAALDEIAPLLETTERREIAQDQAVVMLDSVRPIAADINGQRFPAGKDSPERWAELRRAVGAQPLRWSDPLGIYTLADGTTIHQ